MNKPKLSKKKMKNVGRLFPNPTDVVKEGFSYAQYIEDVNAKRNGILQGYFIDYDGFVDLKTFYSDYEPPEVFLGEEDDSSFQKLAKKVGNLSIVEYETEIEKLHNEFIERVLAGEDISSVDTSISAKMLELATRNEDGSHVINTSAKTK